MNYDRERLGRFRLTGAAGAAGAAPGAIEPAGFANTVGADICGFGAPPCIAASRSNSPTGAFADIIGAGTDAPGFGANGDGGVSFSFTTGWSMVVLDHPDAERFGFAGAGGGVGAGGIAAALTACRVTLGAGRISSMIFGPAAAASSCGCGKGAYTLSRSL